MNSNTHNKFIVPALLIVAFICFSLSFLIPNESAEQVNVKQTEVEPKAAEQVNTSQSKKVDLVSADTKKASVSSVEKRIHLIADRNDLSAYDEQQIILAINDPRVWDFSSKASAEGLPLDATEKQDGRTFFNANPVRIAISIPGDILQISLPAIGEPLLLEVEQANSPKDGLISLSGQIKGSTGTFNMTQGNNVVAGHINTSSNTYSFEIFGETGWVTESASLFTGELPPVIDTEVQDQTTNSSLGHSGEHIVADGTVADGTIANEQIASIDSPLNDEGVGAQE